MPTLRCWRSTHPRRSGLSTSPQKRPSTKPLTRLITCLGSSAVVWQPLMKTIGRRLGSLKRARTLLIREMDALMSKYDVFLTGTGGASGLGITNLTGHPAVAVRAGFVANAPVMLMVTGRLYDEATTLRVALAHERATKWHLRSPSL